MEMLTMLSGLLLPWLAGAAWLIRIEALIAPNVRPSRFRQAGYGFFVGYAALTLAVLASRAWTGQVSWMWVMIIFAAFATASLAVPRRTGPSRATPHTESFSRSLGTVEKILIALLAAWAGLHLSFAIIEVFNQPVYPWDAWETWVYRAKAWFLSGGAAEFVQGAQWYVSRSPDLYSVTAAEYPPLPSVVPYWAALSLGRWSETLVNIPVILAATAMGLALFGQCRESGSNPLASMIAVYLLFSIPLIGTHVALAGYADIWMAGYAGLGFIAIMRGASDGHRYQGALGLAMIALAILVKNEAVVWFLAALLMQALVLFAWRTNLLIASAVLATLLIAYFSGVTHVDLPLLGGFGVVDGRLQIPFVGSFALQVHDVRHAYWDNFFSMGNWNLLWLLMSASLLVAVVGGKPHPNAARRAATIFVLIFSATQIFIFGFTDQGVWADTYTAINRLPIHFVPALIFAAISVIDSHLNAPEHPANTGPYEHAGA
jgi:hypothetical protein